MSFLDSFWQQRLELLLSTGRAAGADLVEVFLERGDRLGVMAEQERVTSVSPAFVSGAGVRVFRGKDHGYRDGFVSTNDLSEAGLCKPLIRPWACWASSAMALQPLLISRACQR